MILTCKYTPKRPHCARTLLQYDSGLGVELTSWMKSSTSNEQEFLACTITTVATFEVRLTGFVTMHVRGDVNTVFSTTKPRLFNLYSRHLKIKISVSMTSSLHITFLHGVSEHEQKSYCLLLYLECLFCF